jgi:hypothetical protein
MNDTNAVEILLVEDNPQDLELTMRALRKSLATERRRLSSSFVRASTPNARSTMGRRLSCSI